jgi:MerR family transcriptional regulator, Zn(II)-responsive regulator of zntA
MSARPRRCAGVGIFLDVGIEEEELPPRTGDPGAGGFRAREVGMVQSPVRADAHIMNLPVQGKVNRDGGAMRSGELAAAAGTTTKTLRFYEESGLLPRAGRATNGYRDFGPEALSRLDFIRRGRTAGLTLAEIREVIDIRDAGDAPCHHVYELITARLVDIDRQIADLDALRAALIQRRDQAGTADPSTCPADAVCRYV